MDVVRVKLIADCAPVAVPKWVSLPLFSMIRFSASMKDSIIFPLEFVVLPPHSWLWLLKSPRRI